MHGCKFILYQIPCSGIHRLGNVSLRHLGEPSLAPNNFLLMYFVYRFLFLSFELEIGNT